MLYNVTAIKKFKNDYAILRRKRFYCQYFFDLECGFVEDVLKRLYNFNINLLWSFQNNFIRREECEQLHTPKYKH